MGIANVRSFGARIVRPPTTAEFGERQYTAADPSGYEGTFSESAADIDPVERGAITQVTNTQIKGQSAKPDRAGPRAGPRIQAVCRLRLALYLKS
jgi:hypothetical protein